MATKKNDATGALVEIVAALEPFNDADRHWVLQSAASKFTLSVQATAGGGQAGGGQETRGQAARSPWGTRGQTGRSPGFQFTSRRRKTEYVPSVPTFP